MPEVEEHNTKMSEEKDRLLFFHIAETDSTNRFLQELSGNEKIPDGSLVLADFQTQGRGQMGHFWESEAGKNLTFSILIYPENVPANMPFVISQIVSLSLKALLDKYLSHISIKWPNDIYYKDKKIAGILIENTLEQGNISKSIIGIGLNVNQEKFLSDAPNPVSMTMIRQQQFERLALLEEFKQQFSLQRKKYPGNKDKEALHRNYLEACYRKDGFHKYRDKEGLFEAKIRDIEPSGTLLLERTNGILSKYAFKEVSFC